jgi:O-antigen ligase
MSIAQTHAAPAPRATALSDSAPKLVFAAMFLPALVTVACGPAFVAFGQKDFYLRVTQVLWCASAAFLGAYMASNNKRVKLSAMAKVVGLFLALWAFIQLMVQNLTPGYEYQVESLQTTVLFLTGFFGFDMLARRFSFAEMCEAASPLAVFLVFVSAIHIAFFAQYIWGRANYFGQHANLGGEFLFSAVAVLSFNKNRLLRWACYGLAFYVLLALQARAAIIGIAIVAAFAEWPRRRGDLTMMLISGLAALVVASLAALVVPSIGEALGNFIAKDVMMVDDPYRGAGSGFSGRDGTWAYGFALLEQHPILGTGLNQSGEDLMREPVHSGYLKNLVEFGIPGMLLNLALLFAIPMAATRNLRRAGIIFAGCFVYIFNARNVNLNIYPFILWIAILPWAGEQKRPAQMARQAA